MVEQADDGHFGTAPADRVGDASQIEDAYESEEDFVATTSQDELTKTVLLAKSSAITTRKSQEELKAEEEPEPQVVPPSPEEPSAIEDLLLEHNAELEAS